MGSAFPEVARRNHGACTLPPMEDLWIMIRIFLIVLAWGGLLLFAGFGLEMASRVFSRGDGSADATGPAGTSGTTASS
jgi:hypothetical protein